MTNSSSLIIIIKTGHCLCFVIDICGWRDLCKGAKSWNIDSLVNIVLPMIHVVMFIIGLIKFTWMHGGHIGH